MLAWNGAGVGNYSQIMMEGGYTVIPDAESEPAADRLAEIKQEVYADVEALEDYVLEEVRELLETVSNL